MMKVCKRIIELVLLVGVILFWANSTLAESKDHEVHWGYEGEGRPEHWGDLKKGYEICKTGKSQSPIDIKNISPKKAPDLEFHYQGTPLNIVNNGHTIQVNYAAGSFLKIGEDQFELLQFHFHAPSEHVIKGKMLAMEMHLVHKNEQGQLAVVGVFIKQGGHNSKLNSIWENFPIEINLPIEKADIRVNAGDLLPGKRDYLFYPGSLTTPPCSEGVRWHLLNQPIVASSAQIGKFTDLIHMNARPIQAMNDRSLSKAE